MNPNLQNLLDAIAEASTYEHISSYLPNLKNENPAVCLLIYVTQPRPSDAGEEAEYDVGEYVTVETPVEIAQRLRGGLGHEEIIGIFPLHEADEAVCLAEWAVEEVKKAGK